MSNLRDYSAHFSYSSPRALTYLCTLRPNTDDSSIDPTPTKTSICQNLACPNSGNLTLPPLCLTSISQRCPGDAVIHAAEPKANDSQNQRRANFHCSGKSAEITIRFVAQSRQQRGLAAELKASNSLRRYIRKSVKRAAPQVCGLPCVNATAPGRPGSFLFRRSGPCLRQQTQN